ncbi:hypothetical protein PPTG_22840 [Phytophthora nicotianae INRA-310]|uniref:Uncharacterized protein n=2 Tax=Phytophthora nicotianae TaxID=4792 RepID=W2Q9J6_PHYN3|nr:hypothetical protein PPTG_22840 [Phytophthora nicotianae INRA-310]ETI47592.1 hypothetical protein F443_08223 [Phytophthora nicotianae P1569]ETN09843.1 hypothetical protein PPTG_22840 [Phytophthora nicotianae INRA-310]
MSVLFHIKTAKQSYHPGILEEALTRFVKRPHYRQSGDRSRPIDRQGLEIQTPSNPVSLLKADAKE